MNRLVLLGIGSLVAAALLIAACSQQAAPSQPNSQAQGTPTASAGGAATGANQAAPQAAVNTGDAASSDADLIGSPAQPSEPGDPSLLGNDTGADTPVTG